MSGCPWTTVLTRLRDVITTIIPLLLQHTYQLHFEPPLGQLRMPISFQASERPEGAERP